MSEKEPTVEQVMDALRRCYDPEIPVNIVDLGLIYDVKVDDGTVLVKMTLTAPGCPAHSFIAQNVKYEVERVEGVKEAKIQVVWDPPWTPDRMSEDAKKKLSMMREAMRREDTLEAKELSMKPVKKGSLLNRPDGSVLLVNEGNTAYRVTEDVVKIWNICDGSRTVGEVTEMAGEEFGDEVKGHVEKLLLRLAQADLLE